ncbi:MAG TPA: Asp-tRNA(Asn)/Glu-tRNA(Gln) amidotransferase subunit GatC [Candidatus Eremiobacteraceae bacterium]|nr:Asp-tRNA(Asn)/Glu-tRNA(Gln) amidotransferase subunit GatC [Candidatus Eremiobacteraceae bacterium]
MADVPIDIAYTARLARIALTEEESTRFAAQFERLFGFIRELQALDVDRVSPTAQVVPLANVLRDDEEKPCLSQEAALANAPEREGPYFKAPRILE